MPNYLNTIDWNYSEREGIFGIEVINNKTGEQEDCWTKNGLIFKEGRKKPHPFEIAGTIKKLCFSSKEGTYTVEIKSRKEMIESTRKVSEVVTGIQVAKQESMLENLLGINQSSFWGKLLETKPVSFLDKLLSEKPEIVYSAFVTPKEVKYTAILMFPEHETSKTNIVDNEVVSEIKGVEGVSLDR